MKISVVIPVYNEEKYIGACLDSLFSQVEKPDEIIVVNNNSTDNTLEIVKKYPVKIIHEKKQGMIPTRNKGFNKAAGDIIARTDADTHVPKNWIKQIKASFIKDKKLVALSGPASFYDVPLPVRSSPWPTRFFIEIFEPKAIIKHDSLFGPNMAIRKSAWEKVKKEVCLEDKDVHEDIDLAIHLGFVGKIKFDNKLIVSSSARRWKKLSPYFEYPYRSFKMYHKHKMITFKIKGRNLVRGVLLRRKKLITHLRNFQQSL